MYFQYHAQTDSFDMVSMSFMVSSPHDTKFDAMRNTCLVLPEGARQCQTKKQKSPQLRGLRCFLCRVVPDYARRGITPTQSSLAACC